MIVDISLLLMISLAFIFFNTVKTKRIICVGNLFTLIWVSTLLLNYWYASEHSLLIPSSKIFLYVIVGLCAFNIVYLAFSKSDFKDIDMEGLYFNDNMFKILFWMGVVLMTPNFINGIRTFIGHGFSFSVIRTQYMSMVTAGNGIYVYLTKIIPTAIFNALLIYCIFKILKKEYSYVFYVLTMIIYVVFSFGARTIIVEFIIEYIIAFYLYRRNNHIKLNYKLIILFIAIILFVSKTRGLSEGIMNVLAGYFYNQFSFLQYILNHPGMFELSTETIHYGTITLGYIVAPIYLFLNIFNESILVPSYHVDSHAQYFYNISTNGYKTINNNTTSLYPFLLDYGDKFFFIGFAMMALMLIIVERCINKSSTINRRTFYIMVYIVIMKNVLYSTVYYGLYSIGVSFTIAILLLLNMRIKIRIGRRSNL